MGLVAPSYPAAARRGAAELCLWACATEATGSWEGWPNPRPRWGPPYRKPPRPGAALPWWVQFPGLVALACPASPKPGALEPFPPSTQVGSRQHQHPYTTLGRPRTPSQGQEQVIGKGRKWVAHRYLQPPFLPGILDSCVSTAAWAQRSKIPLCGAHPQARHPVLPVSKL